MHRHGVATDGYTPTGRLPLSLNRAAPPAASSTAPRTAAASSPSLVDTLRTLCAQVAAAHELEGQLLREAELLSMTEPATPPHTVVGAAPMQAGAASPSPHHVDAKRVWCSARSSQSPSQPSSLLCPSCATANKELGALRIAHAAALADVAVLQYEVTRLQRETRGSAWAGHRELPDGRIAGDTPQQQQQPWCSVLLHDSTYKLLAEAEGALAAHRTLGEDESWCTAATDRGRENRFH